MSKCESCRFAIFSERFGEYKCLKRKVGVPNTEVCEQCALFMSKKGGKVDGA